MDGVGRVDAVHARHVDIHQDDVGPHAADQIDGFLARGCLPGDLEIGLQIEECG